MAGLPNPETSQMVIRKAEATYGAAAIGIALRLA